MLPVYKCAVLAFLAGFCHAQGQEKVSKVTSLPGYGPPPTAWSSGYTYAGTPPNGAGEMYAHWVFVESQRSPSTDPVVVWFQGGPGASSLFGLFVEFGPLLLNADSLTEEYRKSGIPQPIENPYSWNRVANLLVIDNPPPVGFSYCTPAGPSGAGTSCGSWNDTLVGVVQHTVLTRWIKQMPAFASNPLYITGESYAGVYVPMIVEQIVKDPQGINIKGFAVGDGCIGTDVLCGHNGPYWNIEFMHGHGQVSNRLYREIVSSCPESDLKSGSLDSKCQSLVEEMNKAVGPYYSYNLYDTCYAQNIFDLRSRTYWSSSPTLTGAVNDYPCAGPALNIYINRTDVRTALSVPTDSFYFSGDNGAGFVYNTTEKNLLPFYLDTIRKNQLRVLIYNGDADPSINSFITQDKYTEFLDGNNVTLSEKWRPWTVDGKQDMGGYTFRYASSFTFATIRGSGHMVPEYKPKPAYVLIEAFLAGQPLPSVN